MLPCGIMACAEALTEVMISFHIRTVLVSQFHLPFKTCKVTKREFWGFYSITVNFLLSRRMITYVTVIWQLQECFAVRCSARDHSIGVAVNPTLWTYDQGLVLLFVSINVSVWIVIFRPPTVLSLQTALGRRYAVYSCGCYCSVFVLLSYFCDCSWRLGWLIGWWLLDWNFYTRNPDTFPDVLSLYWRKEHLFHHIDHYLNIIKMCSECPVTRGVGVHKTENQFGFSF